MSCALVVLLVAGAVAVPVEKVELKDVVMMENGVMALESEMWSKEEACAGQEMTVLLRMRKEAAALQRLEETFWAVSDPDSASYGKHLTTVEITDIVGADEESLAAVVTWLKSNSVTKVNTAVMRDVIEAKMACSTAETLFSTTIHFFKHTDSDLTLLRASAPHHLPKHIHPHVSLVADLALLPDPRGPLLIDPKAESAAADDVTGFPAELTCGGKCGTEFTTPAVLTKAYNLGPAPTNASGSMAVAEFQAVFWNQDDIDKFSDACSISPKIKIADQIGTNIGLECKVPILGTELCAEALLDIEYIGALGGAIPLTDVFSFSYSLLNWAKQVMDLPDGKRPLVHSVSYGNDEAQQSSTEFMIEANAEFMKFGALGMSVMFASGDQGVLGRSGKGDVYHPDFPATSPYITAVGGTDFVTKGTIGAEKAWTNGGGGFSNTFAAPDYQTAALASYKASSTKFPAASKWNATGRAYPDVSALGGQGNPYCIYTGSGVRAMGVAGTSASCPVFSAVIAKLNEVRLAKGTSPMGFLNTWLYKTAGPQGGFNDVKEGRNCGDRTCVGDEGFEAVEGWDAATGWGTPNYVKLVTLV